MVIPEGAKTFLMYWKQNKLPIIGLPGPTHSVLKRYGQEVNLSKFGGQPAQVTIDTYGQVRLVQHGHVPSDVPSDGEILTFLKEVNEREYASP